MCRDCWPKQVRKENHPNWKGGITPLNILLRGSRKYSQWRVEVFKRDNFTCQDCGDDKGGNLNAHHIKHWAKYPELRFNIENGKTLCKECHLKLHNTKVKV